MESVDVLSMGGGAAIVAFAVGAVRTAVDLPARLLPLGALAGGIGWAVLVLVGGGFDGDLVTALLSGIVTGSAASGAQGWLRTYAPADRSG